MRPPQESAWQQAKNIAQPVTDAISHPVDSYLNVMDVNRPGSVANRIDNGLRSGTKVINQGLEGMGDVIGRFGKSLYNTPGIIPSTQGLGSEMAKNVGRIGSDAVSGAGTVARGAGDAYTSLMDVNKPGSVAGGIDSALRSGTQTVNKGLEDYVFQPAARGASQGKSWLSAMMEKILGNGTANAAERIPVNPGSFMPNGDWSR